VLGCGQASPPLPLPALWITPAPVEKSAARSLRSLDLYCDGRVSGLWITLWKKSRRSLRSLDFSYLPAGSISGALGSSDSRSTVALRSLPPPHRSEQVLAAARRSPYPTCGAADWVLAAARRSPPSRQPRGWVPPSRSPTSVTSPKPPQQTTLSLALVCPRQWQHHRRRGSSACGLVEPSRSLASTLCRSVARGKAIIDHRVKPGGKWDGVSGCNQGERIS